MNDALDIQQPPAAVLNDDLNIQNNINHITNTSALDSPAVESPVTPVTVVDPPNVKIDFDFQEQESDARHEPLPIKPIETVENASVVPQTGSPTADPNSLPIDPPHGTPPPAVGELLEDVRMAEEPTVAEAAVAHIIDTNPIIVVPQDVEMEDAQTPMTSPDGPASSVVDSNGASTSYTTPNAPEDDDGDRPPPAKRARMNSDLDQASIPPPHSATPPPESPTATDISTTVVPNGNGIAAPPVPATPTQSGLANLTIAQHRFCGSTVRTLKKMKDAGPFLRPVDYIALNIPHYPSIIKTPMDFSTIERKLASSNPNKPDPNPENPRYLNADEFVADVRTIFNNALTFNGPDHGVTVMGKRIEAVFDKQLKNMPPSVESKPIIKKIATPPPPTPAPPPKKTRRVSTSIPVIRRSENEAVIGRPKREIHPPPPKDLPYADAPKKHRRNKRVKDDGTSEQLKFCGKLLTDLTRKQHYAIASPFYEPVDWNKLDLPSYPKIVKKPMDLWTMRQKLDHGEYSNATKFCDDFKLMIRNCFAFNPAGTPVNQAGIELQRLFDDKWKNLPPLHDVSDDDEEEDEEDSDEERARTIAMMESQIETMRGSIAALKGSKPKEKKKKEKVHRERAPVASTSKGTGKQPKAFSTKKKGKKPVADDDVLTFEQKKDLSESIGKLDGAKLEKVIQIIHEGVPEIRDSTEEIELEIDLLPAMVLTKLYNFVLRPLRTTTTKRNRPGKGTGTGGLKRKSMDEDVEAEKIRQLEERMALFEQGPNGAGHGSTSAPRAHRDDDSEHSSDSSSASDSSGSDSE